MARAAFRWSLASALAALLLWPRPTRADPQLQATGDAALGWTDNARSAPDPPVPGVPQKRADSFVLLSPGLGLSVRTPQVLQRLSYTLSTSFYFHDQAANTVSNRLDYRSVIDASPDVALTLGASVTQSKPYAASTVVPASSSELSSALPGTNAFVVGTADELLALTLSRHWRAWQGARFGAGRTFTGPEGPRTTDFGGNLGVERGFEADAVGAEVRGDYTTISGGVGANGALLGVQRQIVASGVGLWRHDFGRDFTSRFEAGALRVQRLSTNRGFWHPTGSAALAYRVEAGDAELSYSHRVTTNLLLGQALLVDEVLLRGAIPLTRHGELYVGASAGYQRGRLIAEDASLAAHVNVFLADAALGWQATSALSVGLRYQHIDQRSDANAPPLPLSFVRNTVMLGLGLRLPPDSELPRPYRSAERVDQSDEIRDNAAPKRRPEP